MQRRLPSLCRSAVPLRAVTQQHNVFAVPYRCCTCPPSATSCLLEYQRTAPRVCAQQPGTLRDTVCTLPSPPHLVLRLAEVTWPAWRPLVNRTSRPAYHCRRWRHRSFLPHRSLPLGLLSRGSGGGTHGHAVPVTQRPARRSLFACWQTPAHQTRRR